MSLHFPNASRNYDATRHCICFWGHDASVEVSFHLAEEALYQISADHDEASLLRAFDVNRDRIETAASAAYARKRRTYYRLSAADM